MCETVTDEIHVRDLALARRVMGGYALTDEHKFLFAHIMAGMYGLNFGACEVRAVTDSHGHVTGILARYEDPGVGKRTVIVTVNEELTS